MTADELLANITNRGGLPPTQNVWTPALVLAAADEETWSQIVPGLLGANQEFLTDFQDSPIVGNQAAYSLPARSAGATLRAVKYVDTSGAEGAPLANVEVPDIGRFNITTANAPIGFYFNSSFLNLLPTPGAGTTGSIRMYYTRRPGSLVQDLLDGTGKHTQVIQVVTVSFSVITGSTITTGFAAHNGFMAGTFMDITSSVPPYNLKWKDVFAGGLSAGSTILCPNVDLTSGANAVVPGDFVTLSLKSYVPQGIPVEWHSLIELRVVARILDSIGDIVGAGSVLARAERMEGLLLSLIQPRSSGNPKKMNAWR